MIVMSMVLVGAVQAWGQEAQAPVSTSVEAPADKSVHMQPPGLTLEESVRIALEKNPTVRIAEQQVLRAGAVTSEARAGLGPRLSASATHFRTGPIPSVSIPTPEGPQTIEVGVPQTTRSQLSLALPIDISRQITTAIETADLARLADEFGLAGVQQSVSLRVQEAYLGVLRAQALQRVAEEALASAEEHLRLAQLQQKAGVVPQFDVLRAEVQVANFRQNLVAARNAVDLAISGLNRAMGVDVNQRWQLEEPAHPAPTVVDLGASQQEADRRRPEVLRAQVEARAARKGVRLAKAGLQPSLALVADYNFDANPSGFAGLDKFWDFSAVVSLPLFDSGATKARVRQARADTASADLAEQDTRQQVALEVRQAFLSLGEAEERMRTTEKDAEQAREALRLAQVRYRAGVSTSVAVTDAEVAFTQARSNQVNALYDYQLARARLDRAIGRPLGEYPEEEERK
ncbi:MAG: TolC family protein [Firmicutes bacterium]|nr:TolC family protein [Bacillota bacterium]